MKTVVIIAARILLGLIFVVFGLNGFFLFVAPPEHTPMSGAFMNLLISTGFIYSLSNFLATAKFNVLVIS